MSEKSHRRGAAWGGVRHVSDVGRFVAVTRKEAGLTQAELAARTGVPRRFVNELETGHSTRFLDRLLAVLRGLGVRVVLEVSPDDTGGRHHEVGGYAAITLAGEATLDTVPPVKDLGW